MTEIKESLGEVNFGFCSKSCRSISAENYSKSFSTFLGIVHEYLWVNLFHIIRQVRKRGT